MHTVIFLDNGQSVQTDNNTPQEIAGMVNAGTQKIYECTDAMTGKIQEIVVSHITNATEQ